MLAEEKKIWHQRKSLVVTQIRKVHVLYFRLQTEAVRAAVSPLCLRHLPSSAFLCRFQLMLICAATLTLSSARRVQAVGTNCVRPCWGLNVRESPKSLRRSSSGNHERLDWFLSQFLTYFTLTSRQGLSFPDSHLRLSHGWFEHLRKDTRL